MWESETNMSSRFLGFAIAFVLATQCAGARAEDVQRPDFAVEVRYDVVYATGSVGVASGKPHVRDLKMDVYRPLSNGKPLLARPAVILAFGGGLHRGSKGTDRYEEDGASDTPMGEYCNAFAGAGYVCSSIEYRLVPEDPAPPRDVDASMLLPKTMLIDPGLTARIDVVRQRMGLPLLDDRSREQLFNAMLAAPEDVASAVRFVRVNAARLGIDPGRIALGGFSAGGFAAINAAYGMGVPVEAVFSLSGPMGGFDLRKTARAGMPPLLFVIGQNDLDGVRASAPVLMTALAAAGVRTEIAWMPGFGHFYPMGATSLGGDLSKLTLERRLLRFLDETLAARR